MFNRFVIEFKAVKGNSMRPNLQSGQLLILLKSAYGIKFPLKIFMQFAGLSQKLEM